MHVGEQIRQSFVYCDSEELYQKNLKKQPLDWVWRTTKITYSSNSQGYRCPEWDNCDWDNSILILGGSVVYGIGVAENQTLPSQLSNRLNIPTINLGSAGTGPAHQWINSIRLIENNVCPVAVIYIWPNATRFLDFFKEEWCSLPTGPHIVDIRPTIGKLWLKNPTHSHVSLDYFSLSCEQMWNCPVLHYTMDGDLEKELDRLTVLPKTADNARDMMHPGPDDYSMWVDIIEKDYGIINKQTR